MRNPEHLMETLYGEGEIEITHNEFWGAIKEIQDTMAPGDMITVERTIKGYLIKTIDGVKTD